MIEDGPAVVTRLQPPVPGDPRVGVARDGFHTRGGVSRLQRDDVVAAAH
jgi:hypothetical protein